MNGLSKQSDRVVALWLLVAAYTCSMADRMILSVLFEPIKNEFLLSDTQLALLGGFSFALFYAVIGIPVARLADRSNRKNIIMVSLLAFSAMTALSGLAAGFMTLLILRMLVGVGEAGINPTSQSVVSDYYPVEKRSTAMSILSLGANFGLMLGFVLGGIIGESHGWRAALIVAGAPGILLTLFIWLFFREPKRGQSEKTAYIKRESNLMDAVQGILNSPAIVNLIVAITLTSIFSYGLMQWLPSFFIRVHSVSQTQVGLLLAFTLGVLGSIGIVAGGYISDKVSSKGLYRGPLLIAVCQFITVPFSVCAFFADSLWLCLLLFIPMTILGNFHVGPTFSLLQTLTPVHLRATTAAIVLLLINLIGLGFGPLLIGGLSDLLAPSFGGDSLRVGMAAAVSLGSVSAFFYWRFSRELKKASLLPQ